MATPTPGPWTPPSSPERADPLDRARAKAFRRLLPLLFTCYVIAYVDRANVGFVKLTMQNDLAGFNDAVFGFGMGTCFFLGYFLLEIPGSLLVERWSARKWICRIMVTWGIVAALTAFVSNKWQFYGVRFLLGLAEAGFFPGVLVYMTHWFLPRDRAKAMAWFFIATPVAQFVGPPISGQLLKIGTEGRPELLGLEGWQWAFIFWGIPAVVLGVMVFFWLTDRPAQATWLEPEEREALQSALDREKDHIRSRHRHMSFAEAWRYPKVLLLAAAYFFVVTSSYGIEFFLPSIIDDWYGLKPQDISFLVIIPPIGAAFGQYFVGRSSDRHQERRCTPPCRSTSARSPWSRSSSARGHLWLTVLLFTLALTGLKAYLPAFWALPSLFLTSTAAAGSFGLINSVGNLGGALGPGVLGEVRTASSPTTAASSSSPPR